MAFDITPDSNADVADALGVAKGTLYPYVVDLIVAAFARVPPRKKGPRT